MEQGLRRLTGAGEFFRLFCDVFRSMRGLGKVPEEERIPPELAEKVMLAVSGVNRCAVSHEARETFVRVFGEEKARQMEGYIKSVFFGNLCCNTVEARKAPEKCGGRRPGWLVTLLARPVAGMIRRGSPR